MCGKFTQMMSWRELHELSDFLRAGSAGGIETATPMRMARVIRLDREGKRENVAMRWGFASLRSKTPQDRPEHIHARAETIDSLPTFRDAFAHSRGLLVVNNFNEGEEVTPKKTVQHTITPRDGKPVGIAVLWQAWTHRDEGELLTFAMVTTAANNLISRITDRMPAVIAPEQWATWLGETNATLDEVKALLVPFEGDWDMQEQKKPPPPRPGKPNPQPGLF
ncbi:MAG: SOS response-associated peptidase [Rhizomicrobium sp.]|jgi:putative SOS response-associated peptidase YedK